jgi:hypothetical protein
MGVTPIPCVPPPRPSAEEQFRKEITPKPDRLTPFIANVAMLLMVGLVVFPVIWWLA